MAETKYGKYILYTRPGTEKKGLPDVVARLDNDMLEGGQHFLAHRISPWYVPRTHSPHFHKDAEMLVMLGTDPDDPWNLGAEVHLCMGKEMEEHIITESCLVFIPPKLIHCPISYHKVTKPFTFIQIQYGAKMTEYPCKGLVPEEEFAKMVSFSVDGTQKGKPAPTWRSRSSK
jgi:hypothetical protein